MNTKNFINTLEEYKNDTHNVLLQDTDYETLLKMKNLISSLSHKINNQIKKYNNCTTKCYMCKKFIQDNEKHMCYNTMCISCGNKNFLKRNIIKNYNGKIAIVTGGRIKIGYYTALQLLRCNVRVVTTTRFAYDALCRYKAENDFDKWKHNLEIYQIDFRSLYHVVEFVNDIKRKYPQIDILINNAAQTIRRKKEFYNNVHTLEDYAQNSENTVDDLHSVKKIYNTFDNNGNNNYDTDEISLLNMNNKVLDYDNNINNNINIIDMTKEIHTNAIDIINIFDNRHKYDNSKTDEHGQLLDLSNHNTWTTTLVDVNIIEYMEFHIINCLVPFYLNSKLKENMTKHGNEYSWIINVSSMEGCFNTYKTINHPHTNMAKAALNMMTRTCGKDYIDSNIVMLSVDTGWNTIMTPNSYDKTSPLDCIDGMARILDPIFNNLTKPGIFYKDFCEKDW